MSTITPEVHVPERPPAYPWHKLASECVGTAFLLLFGLSFVILMSGAGSPVVPLLPDPRLRMTVTGFLFGTVGGSIAVSRVGKVSGAHINPMVTLGFWLMGKLRTSVAVGYAAAQLLGAVLGSLPLLLWGAMGQSVAFGATLPGAGHSLSTVVLGEAITTFGLISTLCVFIGFRSLRRFTPATMPLLYAVMVPLEAPLSGTSTNPARSLGPSLISGAWAGWWIYWIGPLVGTLASIAVFSFMGKRIEEAKLYHFESELRRMFRSEGA